MSILSALKKKGAKGKNIEECIKTLPIGSGSDTNTQIINISNKMRVVNDKGEVDVASIYKTGNLAFIFVNFTTTLSHGDPTTNGGSGISVLQMSSLSGHEEDLSEYTEVLFGISTDYNTGESGVADMVYNNQTKAVYINAQQMKLAGRKIVQLICAKSEAASGESWT